LYVVALLDELASGAPTIGAPDIERAFGLTHASITLVIFVVPAIVGFVVEPVVFLASDRYPRKWFVAGGLGAMALASFVHRRRGIGLAVAGHARRCATRPARAHDDTVDPVRRDR
jgi:MFS family permease